MSTELLVKAKAGARYGHGLFLSCFNGAKLKIFLIWISYSLSIAAIMLLPVSISLIVGEYGIGLILGVCVLSGVSIALTMALMYGYLVLSDRRKSGSKRMNELRDLLEKQINLLVDKDFITKEHRSVCEQVLFDIINECTEGEFPEFSCKDRYGDVISAEVAPISKCILLTRTGEADLDQQWIMEMEQFKEFAKGVAAIDKWLEVRE